MAAGKNGSVKRKSRLVWRRGVRIGVGLLSARLAGRVTFQSRDIFATCLSKDPLEESVDCAFSIRLEGKGPINGPCRHLSD
jgi:hypothetical protein